MTVEIDSERLRAIARRFGLPRAQLGRVLGTLQDKLGRITGGKVVVKRPERS